VRIGPVSDPLHLTYCLNIHPGEALDDQRIAIERHAGAVKARVGCGDLFGLGLRLSRQTADELADASARTVFRERIAACGCYAFTVNAFPYGVFHDRVVKESVYAPDWQQQARLDYTVAVARVLAELLPEGVSGSISTVPGSYRAWITKAEQRGAIARGLAACAWELAQLEEQTGRHVAVAFEPEPDCLVETTDESIAFFEGDLLGAGAAWLAAKCGAASAEACIRRHVGVCLDTCHAAMQFEVLTAALRSLAAAGIRVPKVQVSAALRAPLTADTIGRLPPFVDAVYLHQTRIRRGTGCIERYPDLTRELIASLKPDSEAKIRSHFHVPLHFSGLGDLRSTVGDLGPDFFRAVREVGCRHLEIETYTYGVLPASLRSAEVAESIAREYQRVFAWLSAV